MNLKNQKRLAASIFNVGVNRIWTNPERIEDIETAITRQEIKKLIKEQAIKAKPLSGLSKGRARRQAYKKKVGRKKGPGSKKGSKFSLVSRKTRWISRIRALRKRLRKLKERRLISVNTYRSLYVKAKGGEFRSVSELERYINEKNLRRRTFG